MIDILLAAYNGKRFIEEQIESILSQTYQNFNLIIQDDDSNDGTIEILKSYKERYPDKIKVFFNKKNTGSCVKNFLNLIQKSQNEYIMFCDQDDIWVKDKIAITVKAMKELEKEVENKGMPLLVHTDLKVVDENLKLICNSLFQYQKMNYKKDKLNNLLAQNIITGCSIMCNRNLIDFFL